MKTIQNKEINKLMIYLSFLFNKILLNNSTQYMTVHNNTRQYIFYINII